MLNPGDIHMKSSSTNDLSNVLYVFGALTLVLEFIIFMEIDVLLDGPYWSRAAGGVWLLMVFAILCFMIGANLHQTSGFKNKK